MECVHSSQSDNNTLFSGTYLRGIETTRMARPNCARYLGRRNDPDPLCPRWYASTREQKLIPC